MGQPARPLKPRDQAKRPYAKFLKIDGRHPYKDAAPFSYVEYHVRRRDGGRVAYVNFALAKEMGLIPADHPERLNADLEETLLESFGNVIINEYDLVHGTRIDPRDVKDHPYMATRYLQLQHPGRSGRTSGDGRSIWNGTVRHQGKTWDVTSRGTGATCLSPAVAKTQTFFKSGDPHVAYGSGYASIDEGLGDAVFSEIFHLNGVLTERVLCVIEFPGQCAITVRAGLNLLRPSHFFLHLKQGQHARLEGVANYYIDRQLANKAWPALPRGVHRYDFLLDQVATSFARVSAQFEAEYIFCWLDWDGDNIMMDGGIIDYGSIRQFGLFHHEYRYDDDDRWSTNVKEQRLKARNIVQTFAQAVDYLKTGVKKPLSRFRTSPALKRFDQTFVATKRAFLLRRMGFPKQEVERLARLKPRCLVTFETMFRSLEEVKSSRGFINTGDGITCDAIFCMRDVLRELPQHLLKTGEPMSAAEFMEVAKSSYARPSDTRLTRFRRWQFGRIQEAYVKVMRLAERHRGDGEPSLLSVVSARSAVLNRADRITGDAIAEAEDLLVRSRKKLGPEKLHRLIKAFVQEQVLDPDWKGGTRPLVGDEEVRLLEKLRKYVAVCREGL